jgi:dUTP pyrophosphatase
MSLYIYAENPNLRQMLKDHLSNKHRWTDSGFDIPMLEGTWTNGSRLNHGLKLGVQVAAVEGLQTRPSLLLPRSSIGTTPFRLANSIGLIDQGYRGEVQAKVDVVGTSSHYQWDSGTRMFQICQHSFLPWRSIHIVDSLEQLPAAPDNRGVGGFGSTGN